MTVCLSVFRVLAPILEAVALYRTVFPGGQEGAGGGVYRTPQGRAHVSGTAWIGKNSYSFRPVEREVKRARVLLRSSETQIGAGSGVDSALLWLLFCFLSASPWGPG